MNVQISPLQTPPVRGNELDARASETGGRARTYVIGAVALALVLGGFWYFSHPAAPPARRSVIAPVKVGTVETGNMPVVEHTIGTVMANSTVQVNSRVQGQMMQAFFKEGQMVKAGDVLFQIDPRPYQAIHDNAMASMATTRAKADRYAHLKEQNAISPQDYEDAEAAYLQAKANAESARLNLEYTTIKAPISGKTGAILIQPGNMIAAATASTTASSLVTINEIQPVKISLSLPQSDLPRIQAMQARGGLNILISMHEAGGKDIQVPVNFIGNAVTSTTGTIELRASYPNPDMALVPGQLVDVTVALAEIPNATQVPREAVNTGPDGQFVYRVKDGRAEPVPVKVLFDDGVYDAVSGGLQKGELVITDGQLRVLPGGKVNVTGQKNRTGKGGPLTSGRRRVSHAQDHEG
jgi:multidrug efflux system membrane fusion protein